MNDASERSQKRRRLGDSFQTHLQLLGARSGFKCHALMNHFALDQFNKRGGVIDHAFVLAGLDDFEQVAFASIQDVLLDNRCVEQDFEGGHARHFRLEGGKQLLIDDGAQVVREQFADLISLTLREQVIDATEGLPCARCVNRSKDKMPRFGSAHGCLEGFVVAHLTDKADVRVFAHEGAKCVIEVCAVDADFTLIDRGFHIREDVFDRIFNGDNVHLLALVHILQHRSDRGALPRSSHTGEENETLRCHGNVAKAWTESEFLEGLDSAGDESRGDGRATARHEEVHAESTPVIEIEGEVHRSVATEVVKLIWVEDVLGNLKH